MKNQEARVISSILLFFLGCGIVIYGFYLDHQVVCVFLFCVNEYHNSAVLCYFLGGFTMLAAFILFLYSLVASPQTEPLHLGGGLIASGPQAKLADIYQKSTNLIVGYVINNGEVFLVNGFRVGIVKDNGQVIDLSTKQIISIATYPHIFQIQGAKESAWQINGHLNKKAVILGYAFRNGVVVNPEGLEIGRAYTSLEILNANFKKIMGAIALLIFVPKLRKKSS